MKIKDEVRISKNQNGDMILTLAECVPLKIRFEAVEYFTDIFINGNHNIQLNDHKYDYFVKLLWDSGYIAGGSISTSSKRKIFPLFELCSLKINPPILSKFGAMHAVLSLIVSTLLFFFALIIHFENPIHGEINYLTVYILVLIYIFIHELGHIAFASFMGIKAERVGLGLLFFIYPSAFVKINQIYHLKREQAMLVNFGGIVFGNYVFFIASLVKVHTNVPGIEWAMNSVLAIIVFNLVPLNQGSDGYLILTSIIKSPFYRKGYIMIAKLFAIVIICRFIYTQLIYFWGKLHG
ncbi:site-2 protease family protein [Deinococcus sp. LM3]|uniref:site-2 protease family protein n=1 Tax=Deinococcus sp. LM3 TaxID=1938608 RepID=UPI0011817656|nr:site-2 protease family protein [Deinococcus sp. LM3]